MDYNYGDYIADNMKFNRTDSRTGNNNVNVNVDASKIVHDVADNVAFMFFIGCITKLLGRIIRK